MPFSSSIVFTSFTEEFVFHGNFFPGANYSRQQPLSVSPSLGEVGPDYEYHWVRNCTITFSISSKCYFRYSTAFNGFDIPGLQATVVETWTKLSGNPWSATYTNVVSLATLMNGELGNNTGTGNALIAFICRVTGSNTTGGPDGAKRMEVRNVVVFGEPVTFYSHSFVDGDYVLTGGATLTAAIPGFTDDAIGSTNFWRPKTKFHVRFKPCDLEGNEVSKKVLIYFGKVSKLGSLPGAEDIGPLDDVSEYVKETTTPVDSIYQFPARAVGYTRQVDKHGLPLFLVDKGGDAIQCEATKVRVYYRYEEFGRAPASYPFVEILNPQSANVNHLFVSDAQCKDLAVASISLPTSKSLNQGTWTNSGSGSSVAGNQLTAGSTTATFTNSFSPKSNARPYRYLAFDYVVAAGSASVTPITVGDSFGSPGIEKEFGPQILSGSGTCYVDTLNPKIIFGAPLTLRLLTFNQAQVGTGTEGLSRFDGFLAAWGLKLRFANATITVTNIRMVTRFSSSLSHRIGLSDSVAGQVQHQMAGHVDGRDAFRIDRATIASLVTGLRDQQGFTVNSTNYVGAVHGPAADLGLRPTSELAVQDANLELQPDQDASSATIRLSVGALGGASFFYGLAELGWYDDVDVIGTWGSEVSATEIGPSTTAIRIHSPTAPTFDFTYNAPANGLGMKALPDTRYLWPTSHTIDVEHYVPRHPAPQTKAIYSNDGWGRRYHIYVQGVRSSAGILSYDVSDAQRHYRAYVVDGTVFVGASDNRIEDWTENDTGIEASSICIQIEKSKKDPVLFLFVESQDGNIFRYASTDEGETFDMGTQLTSSGSAKMPAARITRDNKHYLYFIDDSDVKGIIFDAALNEIEPEFVAVSGVDDEGLAVDESVKSQGAQRMALFVVQGGDIFMYQGESGRNFT